MDGVDGYDDEDVGGGDCGAEVGSGKDGIGDLPLAELQGREVYGMGLLRLVLWMGLRLWGWMWGLWDDANNRGFAKMGALVADRIFSNY